MNLKQKSQGIKEQVSLACMGSATDDGSDMTVTAWLLNDNWPKRSQGAPHPLNSGGHRRFLSRLSNDGRNWREMLSRFMANNKELNRPQKCSKDLQLILLQFNLQASRREPTSFQKKKNNIRKRG